jgi:DNA-binding transcriptional LysR family regulator
MQIDQIRAFVRCAELGSLSAAARVERVPKSSLSRLLHDLELSLQTRLLDRSSKGMALTDEGRVFLGPARQLLEDIQAAVALVKVSAAAPAGVVRLTAPYTFGVTFLAPLLPGFLRAYPAIDLQVELTSRNLDLAEQGYDLAIRIGTPPGGYVAHRLMGNPLLLCASPGYLAECPKLAEVEDLAQHALLLIGSPRQASALKLTRGAVTQVVTSPPRLMSSDPAVVKIAALAGAGIGQVPLILARQELADGTLVQVLPDWTLEEVDISVIYPVGRKLPPRVRLFLSYVQTALREAKGGRSVTGSKARQGSRRS